MSQRHLVRVGATLLAAILAACGGGGGDSSSGTGGGSGGTATTPTFTVSVTAGSGGTVSTGSATVTSGSTTTITIFPNVGYDIAEVTGCGGSLSGNAFTTGPVTAACSVSVSFRDIRLTMNGAVYERLDSVAYTADYFPQSGIAGATVRLRSGSGLTAADGSFSIKVEPIVKRDYDDVTIDASGYAASTSPWNDSDKDTARVVGVYKTGTFTPRPGFITGIIPHDVGGWYVDVYRAGLFPPTMQRGVDKVGANLVTLVDTIEVTQLDVASAKVTMVGAPPWPNRSFPTISAKDIYTDLTTNARSRGLGVMMMIQVYPDVPIIDQYFASIPLMTEDKTAFWNAWFAQLKPLVLARAAIARDLNMEYLVIGLNHYFMNQYAPYALWQDLISAVKTSGYKGKISIFDGSLDDRERVYGRADMINFHSLFDFLGLSFYAVVTPQVPGEVLGPQQTRARMRDDIRAKLDRHQGFGLPLMVLMGTPSVFGGVSSDEYIEPCLICGSLAPLRTLDLQQQADAYQAMYEVISNRPTGTGQPMGVLTWGYHYRDDPKTILALDDSSYDKSGSVRGKPAEAVMKSWAEAFAK